MIKLHILAFDSMPALVERLNAEPDGSHKLVSVTMDPTIGGFCALIQAEEDWKPSFADEARLILPDNTKILKP